MLYLLCFISIVNTILLIVYIRKQKEVTTDLKEEFHTEELRGAKAVLQLIQNKGKL